MSTLTNYILTVISGGFLTIHAILALNIDSSVTMCVTYTYTYIKKKVLSVTVLD